MTSNNFFLFIFVNKYPSSIFKYWLHFVCSIIPFIRIWSIYYFLHRKFSIENIFFFLNFSLLFRFLRYFLVIFHPSFHCILNLVWVSPEWSLCSFLVLCGLKLCLFNTETMRLWNAPKPLSAFLVDFLGLAVKYL